MTAVYTIESRWPAWAKWRQCYARPHGESFPFDAQRRLVFSSFEEAARAHSILITHNAGQYRIVELGSK